MLKKLLAIAVAVVVANPTTTAFEPQAGLDWWCDIVKVCQYF